MRFWILLLLVPTAHGYEESEAPTLRPDVEAVWHTPDVPEAGTQFQGYLRLLPDSTVQSVGYQVCIVANACIIAPRPATYVNDTWMFDTNDYRDAISGKHYRWDAGSWIGVQWFLSNETTLELAEAEPFPHGVDEASEACREMGFEACSATHYFTFHMAARENAALAWWMPLGALALAVWWRR